MREADFEVLLHLVERLSDGQRTALGRALASASGEPEAVRLLEQAFAAAPRCPHCGAERLQRWGYASGLRRHRCRACRKTFNALTGTSLARLRKKACWLRYGEALAAGMTLARAAAHCGVHLTTSFRWRHRFLRAPAAAREALGGVVEADETFFRRSQRAPAGGGAATPRPDEGRTGAASGRASGASRPGRSRP
jgi:transposase-like protein